MATASGAYAVLADAKVRLAITDTTDDPLITTFCNQANMFVETFTGRAFTLDPAVGTKQYTFDGFDALEYGRVLQVHRGIVSLTTVEVATYTGAPFAIIPASDYFLRPVANELQPGWPFLELVMTNIPSASNTTPAFYPGYNTIRLTGVFGWPAVPDDIVSVALNLVVASYRARAAGGGDSMTIGVEGERTFERLLGATDRDVLNRYKRRDVVIV